MNIIDKLLKKSRKLEDLYKQSEFSQIASLDDIYYCFRLILGRNPNPEECRGHSGMVGGPLDNVVKSYVQSLEFQNRNLLAASNGALSKQKIEDFWIYVDLNDQAVGVPIVSGLYEPHVTSLFKKYLKPGMKVLDIGANVGYFSLLASTLVGPTGKVFAVEPNMENCKLLQSSKDCNGFNQLSVFQFAAGKITGMLTLNTSYSNGTTSDLSENIDLLMLSKTVASVQLDSLKEFDGGVDLIKIDVEGAEYSALLGAKELISKHRPIIVSEFSPTAMPGISGVDGKTYLEFLTSFGYEICVANFDGTIQENKSDISATLAAFDKAGVDHIDILALPTSP